MFAVPLGAQVEKLEAIQQSAAARPGQPSPPAPQLGPPKPEEDPAERLPTTRPARRSPVPAPEPIGAARKQIWKEFRDDYDRHGESDRAALAHKLLRLALAENANDTRRFALLVEVRELAADARDPRISLKSAEAVSFYFDVDPIEQKMDALASAPWPDDTEPTARAILDDWLALSAEALESNKMNIALSAAGRAVAVAHHWGDEQWEREASAQFLKVKESHAQKDHVEEARARLADAVKTLSSRPNDPQANRLLGFDLATKGDWAKATAMLKQVDDSVIRLAAMRDLADPVKPDARVNAGEAWEGAAEREWVAPGERLPKEVGDAFRTRARYWYTLAIRGMSGADKQEIERRMRSLPGGTIFDVAAVGVESPARIEPRPLGGAGGGAFRDLPPDGALVAGFRVSVGPVFGNPCVSSLQPLFMSATGKVEGVTHGKKLGDLKTIEARPGYAVSGIVVKTGLAVDGFKVVFMRMKPDGLDLNDKYESEWIGGRGGGAETPMGCDGKPVIGIQGRSGDGLDAIGLIQAP